MKESDVMVLQEPTLSVGDQFYLPQVLKGLTRLVEGTPEVQAYGVGNSTFHEIASQG